MNKPCTSKNVITKISQLRYPVVKIHTKKNLVCMNYFLLAVKKKIEHSLRNLLKMFTSRLYTNGYSWFNLTEPGFSLASLEGRLFIQHALSLQHRMMVLYRRPWNICGKKPKLTLL